MKYKAPGKCPVCSEKLEITKLSCPKCSTTIEGEFQPCEFCRLPKEELNFLKVFIKCRGSIKEMEKELGLSYPTVRSKLDGLIEVLGYTAEAKSNEVEIKQLGEEIKQFGKDIEKEKQKILNALEEGKISVKEATESIKQLFVK